MLVFSIFFDNRIFRIFQLIKCKNTDFLRNSQFIMSILGTGIAVGAVGKALSS